MYFLVGEGNRQRVPHKDRIERREPDGRGRKTKKNRTRSGYSHKVAAEEKRKKREEKKAMSTWHIYKEFPKRKLCHTQKWPIQLQYWKL